MGSVLALAVACSLFSLRPAVALPFGGFRDASGFFRVCVASIEVLLGCACLSFGFQLCGQGGVAPSLTTKLLACRVTLRWSIFVTLLLRHRLVAVSE